MRVVIAEDQVFLREGLARLFADAGHDVVATLGDARHWWPRCPAAPDLMVVDVRMPPSYTDEGARAAAELKRPTPRSACWSSPNISRRPTRSR